MEKELLYFLYGNVDMAKLTTAQLIQISEDMNFRKLLLEDLEDYENFASQIMQLKEEEEQIKPVSELAKFSTKTAMKVETIIDKSPQKICEMLIKGCEMGIEDISHNLEKAQGEKPQVIELAKTYREFLINKMEKYKKYK